MDLWNFIINILDINIVTITIEIVVLLNRVTFFKFLYTCAFVKQFDFLTFFGEFMKEIINSLFLLLFSFLILDLAHHYVIAILEHLNGTAEVLCTYRLSLFTSFNNSLQFLNFFLILLQ